MAETYINDKGDSRHTEDMQNIITKVPAWILRWGIALFFCVLLLIVLLGAVIRYPDIIKTQLKVVSPNSPKPVVSKISGKLLKILVKEHDTVIEGQILGYMESTARHEKILDLILNLKELQSEMIKDKPVRERLFALSNQMQLGELQSAYQAFFQQYLNYKSATANGFYLKKKAILQSDLSNLDKQTAQLNEGKAIQKRNFTLAKEDYEMHRILEQQRVESKAELRQQENKLLAQKSPLVQIETALINVNNSYSAKQKEILELDNIIAEEKAKFLQSLNSLISQVEEWESKYLLIAPQLGKLAYSGIIQENLNLTSGQEVFYINPGNEAFFGEMPIPQNNMGKVKVGQEVLIKLKSYAFEEYGLIRGRIKYISDVPYNDSVFVSKVYFKIVNNLDAKKPIYLKQGMVADAEIITQDVTILQRISRSILKGINNK